MCRMVITSKSILAVLLAGLVLCEVASAATYSFTEGFTAPPYPGATVTAGTADPSGNNDWANGFENGDNGWIILDSPYNSVGDRAHFGQRDASGFWPAGGPYAASGNGVANVRNINASAFIVRDFAPITAGNVTLVVSAFSGLDAISNSLRIASGGGLANALKIDFGSAAGANQFTAVQDGGPDTAIATAGQNLPWDINFGGPTVGDYIILSVDFDGATQSGIATVTSVNANGTQTSVGPVALTFGDPSVTSIDRISLQSLPSSGSGSLMYIGDFSITEAAVPEPSMVSLAAVAGCVAFARRRARC